MTRTRIAVSLAPALSVLLSTACDSEPLPLEYRTEHLRIGSNLPQCQGDLDDYERTIALIEDDLGLELDRTIDVYMWDFTTWQSRDHECKQSAQGCFHHDAGTIYTASFALEHELVHAVVGNSELRGFFSEGIAQAYAPFSAPFGFSPPAAAAELQHADDVRTATHFVRWLRERWGGYKLGELAKREGSPADFAAIYGVSLADAEADYFADAPAIYPPLRDCEGAELFVATSSGSATQVEFDCARHDVYAGVWGLLARRVVVVSEEGLYSFSSDAPTLSAHRCEDGPTDAYSDNEQFMVEDIPSIYAAFPSSVDRFFPGAEVHTVHLRPGRYQFTVGIDGYEPAVATFKVWPALTSSPGDNQ